MTESTVCAAEVRFDDPFSPAKKETQNQASTISELDTTVRTWADGCPQTG